MSIRKWCLSVVVLLALGVAATVPAQIIQGTLSNFDVWNICDRDANDFHVVLHGVTPSQLGNHFYTGDYPNVNVIDHGTSTEIVWTGGVTIPGQMSHFGFTLNGDVNPSAVEFHWTLNGEIICSLPDPSQKWRALTGGIRDIIQNNSRDLVFVQRRINTAPGPVLLEELLVGLPLWETARIVDEGPVPLQPQGVLEFDFQYDPAMRSYVMMYEVREMSDDGTPGRPMMVFLNAAVTEPEGGFALSVEGTCPGRVNAIATGATPGGTVAYVFALNLGSTTIPGGPCAGTNLDIQGGARLVGTASANAGGTATLSGNAPRAACGHYLQALDVSTCNTSNVVQLN